MFLKTREIREGCGCPKFLAERVFRQVSTPLEKSSLILRQHNMLSLPQFGGTFRQGKWLLEKNGPRLQERSWVFSSETATAFLSLLSTLVGGRLANGHFVNGHFEFQCARERCTSLRILNWQVPLSFPSLSLPWGRPSRHVHRFLKYPFANYPHSCTRVRRPPRYMCRATHVAAGFLWFFRCSSYTCWCSSYAIQL